MLEARNNAFFLDGKELAIYSGAIHYFRVVPEYWQDRLTRLKACGLNCVETYVAWNLHEEVKGSFNYDGILDLRKFICLAQELGLYVILRPGPYICSEWDFGGLPSWILHDEQMQVRSTYAPFLEYVEQFFADLLPRVTDLQHSNGGPIIAMQVENEYGSYGKDTDYMIAVKKIMQKYGVVEMLFTSDNGMGIFNGALPGELVTVNFQEKSHGELLFNYLKKVKQPDKPLMVMEFWSGWFDHWGDKHQLWPVQDFDNVLNYVLQCGASLNLYMFHGGTNFGFMNGANEGLGATNEGGSGEPYAATCTSYDYDAPVAENGDLTPKWFRLKELMIAHRKDIGELPEPPPPIPSTAYGAVPVIKMMPLDLALALVPSLNYDRVLPMELLDINNGGGQGYGFIVYRTQLHENSLKLTIAKVKDRAIILINGVLKATVDSKEANSEITLNVDVLPATLDIIVENMGRVNYTDFNNQLLNNQRKGLFGDVLIDGKVVKAWEIFPLEMKQSYIEKLSAQSNWTEVSGGSNNGPAFFKASLDIVGQPEDTFMFMQEWSKGVVFVNGFNIGRYWSIGPQLSLYIPAPLLRKGANEIIIFELHRPASQVTFVKRPRFTSTEVHTTVVPHWVSMLVCALGPLSRYGGSVFWSVASYFLR